LQALWQEVWHSPHPPFAALFFSTQVFMVLIVFIENASQNKFIVYDTIATSEVRRHNGIIDHTHFPSYARKCPRGHKLVYNNHLCLLYHNIFHLKRVLLKKQNFSSAFSVLYNLAMM